MFMILLFKIPHILLFILHYTLLKHYLCDLRDEIEGGESEGRERERSQVKKKMLSCQLSQNLKLLGYGKFNHLTTYSNTPLT